MNPFVCAPVVPAARAPRVGTRAMRRFYRAARVFALAAGVGLAMPAVAQAVDANTASADQLEAVKGIGPRTASLIVSERERAGPYRSMQDFEERIRGIGPRRAQALQAAGLVIGRGASPVAGAVAPTAAREVRK